jgi:ADP-heptose:LPS heptosyltransferase
MSAMGDVVFALPVAEALRQWLPNAHIGWLIEDRHASLLKGHPCIDELVVFPRHASPLSSFSALKKIRQTGPWDLVLDLQSKAKSALQLIALRSKRKIGFSKPVAIEGAHWFSHETVPASKDWHHTYRNLSMLKHLGWPGEVKIPNSALDAAPPFAWPMPVEIVAAIQAELAGPAPILLHLTVSAYGKDKEWPLESWAELAKNLAADGHPVKVLWTQTDRQKADDLVAQIGGGVDFAPATPSLQHLMALLDSAKLVIGCDSGPLHLAAKRGTPVLGLYGPTYPPQCCPPGPHQVVSVLADGIKPPPRQRQVPSPLMKELSANQVFKAAAEMLQTLQRLPINAG